MSSQRPCWPASQLEQNWKKSQLKTWIHGQSSLTCPSSPKSRLRHAVMVLNAVVYKKRMILRMRKHTLVNGQSGATITQNAARENALHALWNTIQPTRPLIPTAIPSSSSTSIFATPWQWARPSSFMATCTHYPMRTAHLASPSMRLTGTERTAAAPENTCSLRVRFLACQTVVRSTISATCGR